MSLSRMTRDSGSQPSLFRDFYICTILHFSELKARTHHTHFMEGEAGALKRDLRNPKQCD